MGTITYETSGQPWACPCRSVTRTFYPTEFAFCPNCGKKQPERLPEAGDWVWVKAQVKEVDQVLSHAPGARWISDTGSAPTLDREEYERRIANQAKLLTERTNERDDLRKTHARAMARNAEIVTDYHKFDAYLSRISDIIDERCDLSVMMMAIREVLKEWKEAP